MDFELKGLHAGSLPGIAREILKRLPGKRVFALSGPLGSGKTALVQAFCRILGVRDKVVSPTFSLVNEYHAGHPVYHMDLYRLESMAEAVDIGIEDYLGSNNYCFIEWPELIAPLLPAATVFVDISIKENEVRQFRVRINENGKEDQRT